MILEFCGPKFIFASSLIVIQICFCVVSIVGLRTDQPRTENETGLPHKTIPSDTSFLGDTNTNTNTPFYSNTQNDKNNSSTIPSTTSFLGDTNTNTNTPVYSSTQNDKNNSWTQIYKNSNYTQRTQKPVTSVIMTYHSFTSEKKKASEITQIPSSSSGIQRTQIKPLISSTSIPIPQISPTSSKADSSTVIHPTTESSLKKPKSVPKPIPETPMQYEGAKPKSQLSYGNFQVLPTFLDDKLLPIPRPYPYQDLYPYPYLDQKHSNSRYENSNRMEEIYQMSHPYRYAGQINPKQTQSHLNDSEKLAYEINNSRPEVKKEVAKKILELFLQNQANQKQRFMQVTPTSEFPLTPTPESSPSPFYS